MRVSRPREEVDEYAFGKENQDGKMRNSILISC